MSKNKVTRIEIFRWRNQDRWSIMITRKYSGFKVYQTPLKSRAMAVESACISTFDGRNRRFANTPSSVCTVYRFEPKTQPLTVYFVQIGMDGYMPDSGSAYPTLEAAIDGAKEEKRFDLDGFYPDCKVTGNIRRDHEYEVTINDRYHHTIRIVPECVNGSSVPAFTGKLSTRADLESFCDWYNEQIF